MPRSRHTQHQVSRNGLGLSLLDHEQLVRWHLRRFGVNPSRLDDLTQEVWLVALAKKPVFDDEYSARAWLREVCRHLATSDRRERARTTVLDGEMVQGLSPIQAEPQPEHDGAETDAILAALEPEQLDLLALHEGSELPMRVVAALVGASEPTTYARYRSMLANLSRAHRRAPLSMRGPKPEDPEIASDGPCPEVLELLADNGTFLVYHEEEKFKMGRIGNVIVTVWLTRMHERTVTSLAATMCRVSARMGQPVALINIAGNEIAFPNAEERRTLISQIRATAGRTCAMVDVIGKMDAPDMLISIIRGILALARTHTFMPVDFVQTVDEARRVIEPHAFDATGRMPWSQVRGGIRAIFDDATGTRATTG